MSKITPEQIPGLVARYKAGEGCTILGRDYGVAPQSLEKRFKRMGILRPKDTKLKDQAAKIIQLYADGYSSPQIEKILSSTTGGTSTGVLKIIRASEAGVRSASEAHRKYDIFENFFDVIDTEEKAYFLGFLFADGCNHIDANYIRVDLKKTDKDILEQFAKLIYKENPEQHVKDHTRNRVIKGVPKTYHHAYLNINSAHVCSILNGHGCGPVKSLTAVWPTCSMNDDLTRHFIRGYYDGDGGTFVSDVKGRGACMRICGTELFLNEISNIIKLHLDIDITNKCIGKIYRSLLGGNRQIETFLNWLYKDATIYLDRKYQIYQDLIDKNKETTELTIAGTQGYQKRYLSKVNEK